MNFALWVAVFSPSLVILISITFVYTRGNMSKTSVITVKVPEDLKRRMRKVKINWSEYIRSAIQKKLEEQRVRAASATLDEIRARSKTVATDELVAWIREKRERI